MAYLRICFVAALIVTASICQADGKREVAATLDAFHRAATAADFETYTGLMTEQFVFLGTDATERWQGQAFHQFVQPYFSTGQGWRYVPSDRHIQLSASGEIAWFDEALSNDKLGQCRGSGVLLRDADGWKLAQYNLSMPVPNDMISRVAQEIADGDPDV